MVEQIVLTFSGQHGNLAPPSTAKADKKAPV
eukprot:CAMPEP_0179006906 /NCGR_PEP_ID=MMETSP0795-20121207/14834_1 /TAXON_ID=88552 /ORGANISM="Amoebophrya sp., Strain Ameob2" /LENGTH=30 /DNA_ID= /DNA_START= /DNA_END= /DNA_ORIENTATION=